jgi:hypothetical protein
MTANEIASLLDAHCTGTRRWMARCPSHDDRNPSLSIGEGRDGRVLVRCWAGCPTEAVLSKLGLRMSDLFDGPPPSPEQVRKAALERAQRDAEALKRRAAHAAACDRLRKLEAVCNSLGERLARQPDIDVLAGMFHTSLEKLREAEAEEAELRQ